MSRRPAGIRPCASVTLLVVAVSLIRPDVSIAQGSMARAFVPKYEVTGFREARFGMTEPQIRLMAKKAFRIDDGDMTPAADAVAGTTKLIVHVPMLEPGLGEGRVEYVFGYRQHRLFQVNVVWGLDTNPQLSNFAIIAGALRFQRYFLGFSWALRSVQTGILLDDRAILLFSGVDGKNGAVTVVLDDVRYELISGNIRLVPEPSVPTRLTISYMDESRAADLHRLSRSEF